ncbi:hypothetical protein JE024_39300 (plasmid) [Streptomyces zhihengii]|uniref:30S ribosomal protein S18 n=1 Tax=Streptomyces zhihengii TaxID=1818004 RepID=A0ABS2V521_9ACTN|nr:hypothetical protein [Streptomyces zhihengii]
MPKGTARRPCGAHAERGKIRSRRVSAQQQRQLAAAIKNARELALLAYSSAR